MKIFKINFLIILFALFLTQNLTAAPVVSEDTNLLKSIRKSLQNTFENPLGFFDGVIDSDPQFSALSQDIYGKIQQIVVELPAPAYLREARVYWDLKNNYDDYFVQYTVDGRSWFNLKRVKSYTDKKSLIHVFEGGSVAAKGFRLMINAGTKTAVNQVRIQEIELYPAVQLKNKITEVKTIAVTDTEMIVDLQGTISGKKTLEFVSASYTSLFDYEAVAVFNLKPDQLYVFNPKMIDFNQNVQSFQVQNIRTKEKNLALNRPVTGTFDLPADPLDGTRGPGNLSRITDGCFDLNLQTARSEAVPDGEQYFVIDLGVSQPLKEVVLFWDGLAYPQNFNIETSNDGTSWAVVAKNLNAADGALSRVLSKNIYSSAQIQSVALSGNANGRYLRVFIPANADFYHRHSNWQFVRIYECKVF